MNWLFYGFRNWVDGSKRLRLLGFLVVLVLGGLLARFVGPKAGGPHDLDLMVRAELIGNGSLVSNAPPVPPSRFDYFTVHQFHTALKWDVPFIVGYTLLFVAAVWLVVPLFRLRLLRTKARSIAIGAAVAAGGFDLIEDLFLYLGSSGDRLLNDPDRYFLLATTFAIAKFVVLVGLLCLVFAGVVSGLCTPQWLFEKLRADAEEGKVDNIKTMSELDVPFEEKVVGLCFSGGGVRAASLTLGSLQELELGPDGLGWSLDKKITAVSGGAYMAGAWQLGRAYRTDAWQAEGPDGKASLEERHLLKNLGYLASTWSRGHRGDLGTPKLPKETEKLNDRLRSGASVWATIFTGFAFNLMVIGSALLLLVITATVVLDELVGITTPCQLRQEIGVPKSCVVAQPRFWLPPVFWLALGAITAALWVLVSKVKILRLRAVWVLKAFKGATRGVLALGFTLMVLLLGFPYLVQIVYRWDWQAAAGAVAGLMGTLGALVRVLIKRSAPLAAKLGGVAFIALLVLSSGWLAVRILELGDRSESGAFRAMVIVPLVVLLLAWLVRPELWSLNAFYRGKLRIAYAVRRFTRADGTQAAVAYVNDADSDAVAGTPKPLLDQNRQPLDPPPEQVDLADPEKSIAKMARVAEPNLSALGSHTPLTICAAAHVTTRGVAAHYGIPAMSFTFTPELVRTYVPQDDEGTFKVIQCATKDLEACYGGAGWLNSSRITTMFAVALAGAAVSPAMGRFRIGPTSALITFGNVRLGAWLPNPRYVKKGAAQRANEAAEKEAQEAAAKAATSGEPEKPFKVKPFPKALGQDRFPRARLSYLVKEFCGIHDPSDPYVYVTDGGHWENTGLVEVLRTPEGGSMPREVIAIDADPGSPGSVHQLSSAIDLAALECGVRIYIDLDPVRAFSAEPGGPVYASRSVALGVMRKGDSWGLLWYAKPVLSKDSPTPLLAHREIDSEFPHTTTVDQFFDTSTYVAYRDLGRFNAREIKLGREELSKVLAKPWMGMPDRVTQPYPGSWAVEDFRRLAKDFPDSWPDLMRGALKALGAPHSEQGDGADSPDA